MSYIRSISPYTYVDKDHMCGDYVYGSTDKEGNECIVDHGRMANETIIDILLRIADINKDALLKHCMLRLCENLNIKLREKPLTDLDDWFEESDKLMIKIKRDLKDVEKELKEMMEEKEGDGKS